MNESFILILLGVAGVAFGCLIKMRRLQGDADSANVKFGWGMYWRKDYLAILASFLSVAIWYGVFGEWAKKYPYIIDIKRTLFVFCGYGGAELIQFGFDSFGGSAKKYIRKYVDIKTNISDMMTNVQPASTLEKVIEKGNEVTGEDVTKAPPAPKDVTVPEPEKKD